MADCKLRVVLVDTFEESEAILKKNYEKRFNNRSSKPGTPTGGENEKTPLT